MASETAPALGEGVHMPDAGKILDAKTIIGYRDQSMERIERVLLESLSELVDGHDVEFENQKRGEFYAKLEANAMNQVKDGQDLFDVSIWIKNLSDASEIDERATQKQMLALAAEEVGTVSQSLNTAKGLKERMKKISESLVTTARNEHTTLKNKLKEQYFAFQAQLTDLVANLEVEENKRRSLAMTNIMLKQKMQMLKMRGTKQDSNSGMNSGTPAAGDDNAVGDAGGQDTKAALAQRNLDIAQRNLDIAQLRARMEDQRDQLDKLKATNLKQGAELMNFREIFGSSEEAKKNAADKARSASSEKEVLLLKLLQHSRDALDRKPYPNADAFDAGVPLSLGSLPLEITKLYKILDEYSQKLERLQNHVMESGGSLALSEPEKKHALESLQEMMAMKKRIQEMQAAAEQHQQMILQQASMIEKANKMRRGGLGDPEGNDLEEEYVHPVTGQDSKRVSPEQLLKEKSAALEAICSRIAQFHNSVVDDIVGVGSSSLTRPKMDDLKKAATDAAGSKKLVQIVCGVLEEYLTKYWAESGIRSMAENIKKVRKHNAKQASAKFEHLSELQNLAGMINDAKQKDGKGLDGLLKRCAEKMQRWELRKAQLIQERAEAILKCMSSVLQVVTLNIGIKIAPRDQQTITHTLQQSCIGRDNAFWPSQKAATEIVATDSIPPPRAQTTASGRKSNGVAFSVTRLPLHRMAHEGSHRDPSSWRSSKGSDSIRLETAGGDLLGHRSPRNLLCSPGATRASARRRGDSPTKHAESPDAGFSLYPIYSTFRYDEDDMSSANNAREAGLPSSKDSRESNRTGMSPWRKLSQGQEIVNWGGRRVTISSDANRMPGGNSGPADKVSAQKLPHISKAKLQSSVDFYDEISSELGFGHTPTPWKEEQERFAFVDLIMSPESSFHGIKVHAATCNVPTAGITNSTFIKWNDAKKATFMIAGTQRDMLEAKMENENEILLIRRAV